MTTRAILVASFGSSYEETREKTIGQIEQAIRSAYPEYAFYSAYTSKRIRAKILLASKKHILGVAESLEKMLVAGIEEVYIQPTFIIEGVQYNEMMKEALYYKERFKKMIFGKPLLTSIKDYKDAINVFTREHPVLKDEEAVICMGHGADEHLSVSFAALDYMFKDEDYDQYYVATIRSYPAITQVLRQLKKRSYRKAYIFPFMVVAGYHAHEDILGKAERAWKNLLEKQGYEVVSELKGLGEYRGIQEIYIRHVDEMLIEADRVET